MRKFYMTAVFLAASPWVAMSQESMPIASHYDIQFSGCPSGVQPSLSANVAVTDCESANCSYDVTFNDMYTALQECDQSHTFTQDSNAGSLSTHLADPQSPSDYSYILLDAPKYPSHNKYQAAFGVFGGDVPVDPATQKFNMTSMAVGQLPTGQVTLTLRPEE